MSKAKELLFLLEGKAKIKTRRIRISGRDSFDTANISCKICSAPIIKNGEPMTPIYYVDNDGNHYCVKCNPG